ncbi:unnamed protein product [Ilex paraguariensis]|uniref:Uncharacterized protein n=1 Tax=Ilex paraguariensis TaxID=185542 RepID=A0ABC8SUU4_9AQUA
MDFHYSLEHNMDMMDTVPRLEFEGDEDDVFYAELRRQILLLTGDDEDGDDDYFQRRMKHSNAARNMRRPNLCSAAANLPGGYFNWSENENNNSVPAWLSNLWRSNGTGTGVFIPHVVKSSRRRRKNNDKGRMYKPVAIKNV